VTFINLLKGNWFLGILLSQKPFLLDRCPVSGSLVIVPRWLPVDGFEALHSALQARKQMSSYLSLVHGSLQRFDLAFWCFEMVPSNPTSYNMITLRWGALQVPANARNRSSPYPIWGLKYLIGSSSLPQSFIFYPDYGPPWVDTWGGSVALLFLPKLHCQPNLGYPSSPPLSSFWVEVKNSGKPVAVNDLSTPYNLLPWSREMPQLAVVNKTLI
jgi:hypothetical protein